MGGSCVFEGAGESRFNCTLDIARSRPLIMITSLLLVKWGGERGSKDWWKGWCKGVRGRTIAANDAALLISWQLKARSNLQAESSNREPGL